jgi:hypothetical protein
MLALFARFDVDVIRVSHVSKGFTVTTTSSLQFGETSGTCAHTPREPPKIPPRHSETQYIKNQRPHTFIPEATPFLVSLFVRKTT